MIILTSNQGLNRAHILRQTALLSSMVSPRVISRLSRWEGHDMGASVRRCSVLVIPQQGLPFITLILDLLTIQSPRSYLAPRAWWEGWSFSFSHRLENGSRDEQHCPQHAEYYFCTEDKSHISTVERCYGLYKAQEVTL